VGRDKIVVENLNGTDFAVSTGGQEAAEGFIGVLRVRAKHSLEDYIVHDAQGLALSDVFFCQPFKFSGEPVALK
jgi:hypothetical protein